MDHDLMHPVTAETLAQPPVRGHCELVADTEHLQRVIVEGVLKAQVSVEIMTADFKAMLVPQPGGGTGRGRRHSAPSIVKHLVKLAKAGVEVRLLHAGVPSRAALDELHGELPTNLTIRRCPRLHAKAVVIDSARMYLGSANLTGAGLGAKGPTRRNFELGVWTEATPMIDAVLGHFNELWEGSHCEGCGRRDVCPVPLEEPDLA